MRPRPLKKRSLFKPWLQYKLIAAFLFIGIGPMVLSTFIAVKFISARLEKDIENRIRNAGQIVQKEIENLEKRADLASTNLVQDPNFIRAFRRQDNKAVDNYSKQFMQRNKFKFFLIADLSYPYPLPSGESLMFHEGTKQLVAGVGKSIEYKKKIIGKIATGHVLDDAFVEDIKKNTGIEIVLLYKYMPENLDKKGEIKIRGLNPTEEIIETVFKKGKTFYAPNIKFNDMPSHALYQPLVGTQGAVLGMIFFGIPRQYSFQTVISGQKFFPLIIGLGAVLASLFGYTIARGITNPINSFVKAARAISSGDFDQKVDVHSRDEIGVLAASFNLMTRKLRQFKQLEQGLRRKERLAALGELSAGVAHEIRNPLSVIKNSAEIIKKKQDGHKIKELSAFIIDEVNRLNRVVGNLLEFARPRPPQLTEENITALMERTVKIIEGKAQAKGVRIKKQYSPNLPEKLLCDSWQLEQAFLNILINALGGITCPKGGEIFIRILPGKEFEQEPTIVDYLYIQVKDTGSGIKDEDMPKIFNPFFTTKSDGTGLGLSIVHKIIENHDGEIGVESRIGEGTTITIKIPVRSGI